VGYEGEGSVCVGSEVGAAEVEDGEAVVEVGVAPVDQKPVVSTTCSILLGNR
jgi:hypothetical protein